MYFINDQHEKNYHELAAKTPLMKTDKAYRSAGYLLAVNMIHRTDITDFFNGEDGFHVDEFLAMARFSMGQQDIIKMASTLFNGYLKIDLSQAMNRLDDPHYAALVQAMEIRRPDKRQELIFRQESNRIKEKTAEATAVKKMSTKVI